MRGRGHGHGRECGHTYGHGRRGTGWRPVRGVLAACLVGTVVLGTAAAGPLPTGAAPGDGPDSPVSEADLAQHGSASMAQGRVSLRFTPQNFGPSDISDATTRLDWSVPLADEQTLPARCVRAGRAALVCRTGGLTAGGLGDPVDLAVRLEGAPTEVLLRIDTLWNGGARDDNPDNHRHEVLVLETGDVYHF
ncbi:hypothetical protein [Streptomyces sp. NPDC059816]|uniref:hypothetical protein n=1 Tax=Streptomyces sp. NPDC059816 TaxID=3346960 RepID=UPI00366584B5